MKDIVIKGIKKKVRIKKPSSRMLSLLPVRRYDYENECYIRADGTIEDLVCIKSKSLDTQSQMELDRDILLITKYFRLYKDDIKIIAINIPINCSEQVRFLNHKINNCTDYYRKKQLEIKKAEMEWLEKNRLNKEFYIKFFSRDLEEHRKHKEIINENLGAGNMLVSIEKRQKDIVLMKMNNKNIRK